MNKLIIFFSLALGISFLCSLLESVLLSVSHAQVVLMERTGKRSGRIMKDLKNTINRPLAAILTLNTIANTVGAAGVGAQTLLLFGNQWVALASGVLTLSILIFSEIIPKTLGAVYFKILAGPAAYIIKGLIIITYPFVFLSETLAGIIRSGAKLSRVTREEMIVLAEMGEDEGTLQEQESEIIENLLRLREVKAEDVLTPRSVVFALQKDATVGEVLKNHSPIAFSRIPIYDKDLDDVIGFIHRYDLVNKQAEDQFDVRMEEIMEPIHTVQETDSVANILDEFVKRRQQIFLVRDEFGSTVGIITLEDAIETLLGVEIVDEHDSIVDMRKFARDKWIKERRRKP
ncbi:MAG: HlyC/CorC family transporter [FCB group bacterium]|nr:HlyC/CorC family transporter [FCB group bacterium]